MDRDEIESLSFVLAVVIGISSWIIDIISSFELTSITLCCCAYEFFMLFYWWRKDKRKRKLRDVLNYFERWEDESGRE